MLPQHAYQSLRSAPWTAPVGTARTDLASAPSSQAVARQAARAREAQESWDRIFAAAQAAVNRHSIEMSERPL